MDNAVLVVTALAWVLLPGLLVGAAIGLRGWLLVSVAPALTMGVIAGASLVAAAAGIRWSPAVVVIASVVLAAVLVAVARPWRSWTAAGTCPVPDGSRWAWWQHLGITAALVVTGVLGAVTTFRATDGFQGVNQTWDAFFHAGAIRLIAESGDPSPASLGAIAAQASTSFFTPDAYHAAASLIYLSTGTSVVVVVNVLAAVLPLLLGLGMVGLFRVTTGRPAHAVCGALFSVAVVAVPYHMIGYGTLLPYGTTLVMLPGVTAVVAATLRTSNWRLGAALGFALAGLLNSHPQVAFLAAIVAALQLGWHVAQARRITRPLWVTVVVSLLVFVVIGGPVVAATLRSVSGAAGIDWPAYTSAGGAFGDLLLFNAASRYPQWWLAALMLVGLAAIVARGADTALRPFVAGAVLVAGLYILAGAYDGPLSLAITSLWWNDRHRLAAAFAVFGIVFAAAGAVWLRDRIGQLLLRGRPFRPGRAAGRPAPAVLLVTGLLGFFVVTGGGYVAATQAALAEGYGTAPTLSDAERAGLATVDGIVRAGGGGTVMNDPHDGCGWAYALYGTEMVFPTPLTGPFDWANLGYDRMRLYEGFDRLDTDIRFRIDGERLGVRWAVLCTGFIRPWQTRAPGLVDVAGMESARLAFSNGAVQLYQIDSLATDPNG